MTDLADQNAADAQAMTRRIIGPTILMGDGLYFDFEAPDATGMTIEDYAWGLAASNRFRGQTRDRFGRRTVYNVAQHCVLLASAMHDAGHPREAVYQGLMHESDEVVWGDLPGPAKALLPPEVRALIKRSADAIDRRFAVPSEHKDLVKHFDLRMLATEKRDLMPHASAEEWSHTGGAEPLAFSIDPWKPGQSARQFVNAYNFLKGTVSPDPEREQMAVFLHRDRFLFPNGSTLDV